MYTIRSLTRADELTHIMELQALVCGQDPAYQIRLHTLIDMARNGGQIIAAFDRQTMIGFLVTFLGTESRDPHRPAMANLKLTLSRLGVHPDYRGMGVATQMMLRLRDIMIKQGIRLLTYAFDPFSSREAYLLIHKLGAIAKVLWPDYYGAESDRLVAQWWVTHNRVEERLFGQRSALTLAQYLEAETPILYQEEAYVARVSIPDKALVLVEIALTPEAEEGRQQHTRDVLLALTEYGYIVTDFLIETHQGRPRAFYLLSFDGPRFPITI